MIVTAAAARLGGSSLLTCLTNLVAIHFLGCQGRYPFAHVLKNEKSFVAVAGLGLIAFPLFPKIYIPTGPKKNEFLMVGSFSEGYAR